MRLETIFAKEDTESSGCLGKLLGCRNWMNRGLQCGLSGNPVFQFLFCKVKNQKLFGWVWFALWIALSVFFIVEFGFGDGHMPLVVKAIVIGAVLVFLWYDFIRYCRKKRKYTVKYGKTTAP